MRATCRRGLASPNPHFYWPDPSLLSARSDPVTPAAVTLRPKNMPPEQPPLSPGLGPSLFGKPSSARFVRRDFEVSAWFARSDVQHQFVLWGRVWGGDHPRSSETERERRDLVVYALPWGCGSSFAGGARESKNQQKAFFFNNML